MLKISVALVTLVALPLQVLGHGMVMDPVNRASRWRVDPTATPDYTDNGLYCGGYAVTFFLNFYNLNYKNRYKSNFLLFQSQWITNNGKCGVCGDSYSEAVPRAHEFGGTYGQGVVVKTLVMYILRKICK